MKQETNNSQQDAQQSRSRKFVKDLGIYAIGNLGSKLITFLLIPFYTYYITNPADFGYYDLCINTMFCLIPLLCMQMQDGAFRFLIDNKDEEMRKKVISFVYCSIFRNALIILVIGLLLCGVLGIKYFWYTLIFGVLQTFYDVSLYVIRGLGDNKQYVYMSILNTLLIAALSVLTVAVMGLGIPGVFISNILARVVCVVVMNLKLNILKKYVKIKFIDKQIGRDILRYSMPLIPMALLFWLMGSNSVYFLNYFCGLELTGLYGFVGKFTGIMFIICTIFYQTWQQNALEQYQSKDRDQFFSTVFNNYLSLLTLFAIVFSFGLKLIYPYIVSSEYQPSSAYLCINSFYVVFYSLAAFFELGYQCSKQTHRILPAIIIAIMINVGCNYIFVQLWQIYGVIYSNIIAWAFVAIYRAIDTRKYMKIRFTINNIACLTILVLSAVVYAHVSQPVWIISSMIILILVFFMVLPKNVRTVLVSTMLKPIKK